MSSEASSSPLQSVRGAYSEALKFPPEDQPAFDYTFTMTVGQHMAGVTDPFWGWIIGPPGIGKGELLSPLEGHPISMRLDSLTPGSLASGHVSDNGEDCSLLPQLDGKTVFIKEFSTMLFLKEADLLKILADLRGIYDGAYAKATGTMGYRQYKSSFGFLCAVTPKIEAFHEQTQQLGERMIAIRIGVSPKTMASRIEHLRHIMTASRTKEEWRNSLRSTFHSAINSVLSKSPDIRRVSIPPDIQERLFHLADLVARLRTLPHSGLSPAESAGRLLQQLTNLGSARCICDSRTSWTDDDYLFITRVARDTLPLVLSRIISAIHTFGHQTLKQLAASTNVTGAILSPYLHQYQHLSIVVSNNHQRAETYSFSDEVRSQIDASKLLAGDGN